MVINTNDCADERQSLKSDCFGVVVDSNAKAEQDIYHLENHVTNHSMTSQISPPSHDDSLGD